MILPKLKSIFWFLYSINILLFFYIGLIIVDFLIPRISSTTLSKFTEADNKFFLNREQQEEKLLDQGYINAINLAAIERHIEFKKVMTENSALGISSYPNKDILYCDEGYGWQIYKSDRYGFRNFNKQYDKQVDVALFGDSYVHGGCVPTEVTISQTMSEVSNTLGFGLGGSDPIHYAAMINVMIPKVLPKKAGIAFYNNDFNDSDRSSIFYKFFVKDHDNALSYFDTDGDLSLKIVKYYEGIYKIHKGEKTLSNERWPLSYLDKLLKIEKYFLLNNVRAILFKYFPKIIPLSGLSPSSKIAIDELVKSCNYYGCEPFITYLPHSNYWNPNYAYRYYESQLKKYSRKKGVKFISLDKIVDSNRREDFAPHGGHYSIETYQRVGNHIAYQLRLKK